MDIQYLTMARSRWFVVFSFGLITTCLLILFPLVFASINALALSAWIVLQLLSVERCKQSVKFQPLNYEQAGVPLNPFFSIHVASHNEPADVVCSTLNALARIKYPCFEVIVIDNNTSDRTLWEPVSRHCSTLGARFTFLHRMNVLGAKAGALNIARRYADACTDYIVTVDADYKVSDDILVQARSAFELTGADYVQFPQSYEIQYASQLSLATELGDYFDRYAQGTARDKSMLLTGTLSVISVGALDQAGGWPTQTVTEDAELGIELQRQSFHGVFINHEVGQGLLPPSGSELRKQRHRWITGNVQVLIRAFGRFPHKVSLSHTLQLSAWCSFIAVPYFLLVWLPLVGLVVSEVPQIWHSTVNVVLVSVLAQMLSYLALSRTRPGFFGVKWGLALSSSWASLFALSGWDIKFRCTRRVAVSQDRGIWYLIVWYSPLVAGLVCSVILNWWNAIFAGALLLSSAVYYIVLDAHLKHTQDGTRSQTFNQRASHVN